MASSYYVRIRGRVSGPFAEDKLATLVQRGQLSRAHEVSEDGEVWSPAGQLTQLFVKRSNPVLLKSDRSLTNENNDAITPDAAITAAQPPGATWYYAVDGQKSAPMTWAAIQRQAAIGTLPDTALVWTHGMANWQAAHSIPGIFPVAESVQLADEKSNKRQIPWSEILPVFRVLNDGGWSLAWVQCLAVALLFPLLALEYQNLDEISLTWAAISFSLYFSLLWIAFFHWCISPSKLRAGRVVGAWVLTATLGILAVVIVEVVVGVAFIDALDADSSATLLKRIVGWTLAVGLIEEAGKLLAVLAATAHIQANKLPRTCAFIGVVSGLAFGTIEAVGYTWLYVAHHAQSEDIGVDAYGQFLFLLMLRWISLPLLHAVWGGITGFFVGLSYHAPESQWRWVVFGLFTAALLHGIYNAGQTESTYSWLSVAAAVISLALLIGYLRTEDTLIARIEQSSVQI